MDPSYAIEPRPYLLANSIQHYAWGERGQGAFIPRLLGMEAGPGKPYAELWLGAHPSAPSMVVFGDRPAVSLRELVSRFPREILGGPVTEKYGGELPFLFKVLSAAEALSIQVHPNREQARALHARDPEHYPDAHHKPELAVALDRLAALAGFKSVAGIRQTLADYPELAAFVGPDACASLASARTAGDEPAGLIRPLFSTLVERSIAQPEALLRSLEQLEARLKRSAGPPGALDRLFLELRDRYPGPDAGLFAIFLLNLVRLEKGQGLYIGAGVPHAYIEGNIVECMASSDNVVRLGLTPKFKDAEALVEILDYDPGPPPILDVGPESGEIRYHTPAEEFQVARRSLRQGEVAVEMSNSGPQLLLVTGSHVAVRWGAGPEGGELSLRRGQSLLIPAVLREYRVSGSEAAELYRVSVPGI